MSIINTAGAEARNKAEQNLEDRGNKESIGARAEHNLYEVFTKQWQVPEIPRTEEDIVESEKAPVFKAFPNMELPKGNDFAFFRPIKSEKKDEDADGKWDIGIYVPTLGVAILFDLTTINCTYDSIEIAKWRRRGDVQRIEENERNQKLLENKLARAKTHNISVLRIPAITLENAANGNGGEKALKDIANELRKAVKEVQFYLEEAKHEKERKYQEPTTHPLTHPSSS